MIFSQRYHRALTDNRFTVTLSEDARRKIRTCIEKYNTSLAIQRDPNDGWISNSSVIEEATAELLSEHGWDHIPGTEGALHHHDIFKYLVRKAEGPVVFDFIELSMAQMGYDDREKCRAKINQIFDLHGCPWRIADGEFFKLDADFMGERLAASAHDALVANRFVGAADEDAKARQELGSQETLKTQLFVPEKALRA